MAGYEQQPRGIIGRLRMRRTQGPEIYPREIAQHKREEAYHGILEAVDRSPDPVGTGLNILFEQNHMDSVGIERDRLTAGVEMYFGDDTGGRQERLPDSIKKFTAQLLPERSVVVNKITVIRSEPSVITDPGYPPRIAIDISADPYTASPAERESGRIISSDQGQALSGYVTLRLEENGAWSWGRVVSPMRDWIVSLQDPVHAAGSSTVERGTADPDLIKDIAKLIPMQPIHVEEGAHPNKRIIMTPNYVPEFGIREQGR